MPLRFGSFKPNWPALGLVAAFSVGFLLYIVGYGRFASSHRSLYDEQNNHSIESMKFFLLGCPIVLLITQILLFVVSSFQSRQILIGFSAMHALGCLGFLLVAAWLATNLMRFNTDDGWETCTDETLCSKLKSGIYAFLAGSVVCCLICIADLVFCFLRSRQLKSQESTYVGLQTDDIDGLNGSDEHEEYLGGRASELDNLHEDEEDAQ